MSLDLANYEAEAREAVKLFWGTEKPRLRGRSNPEIRTQAHAERSQLARTWTPFSPLPKP